MNRHRFAPVGDLDTAEVDALRLAMLAAIGDGPADVTLDASDAGYTGAAFLGLLADLAQRVEDAGGTLSVRGASDATRRIMTICELGHLLVDEQEAPPATITLPSHDVSLEADLQNLK